VRLRDRVDLDVVDLVDPHDADVHQQGREEGRREGGEDARGEVGRGLMRERGGIFFHFEVMSFVEVSFFFFEIQARLHRQSHVFPPIFFGSFAARFRTHQSHSRHRENRDRRADHRVRAGEAVEYTHGVGERGQRRELSPFGSFRGRRRRWRPPRRRRISSGPRAGSGGRQALRVLLRGDEVGIFILLVVGAGHERGRRGSLEVGVPEARRRG
jgi:hypothetical protein